MFTGWKDHTARLRTDIILTRFLTLPNTDTDMNTNTDTNTCTNQQSLSQRHTWILTHTRVLALTNNHCHRDRHEYGRRYEYLQWPTDTDTDTDTLILTHTQTDTLTRTLSVTVTLTNTRWHYTADTIRSTAYENAKTLTPALSCQKKGQYAASCFEPISKPTFMLIVVSFAYDNQWLDSKTIGPHHGHLTPAR